jgi:regulator of sigma E protease
MNDFLIAMLTVIPVLAVMILVHEWGHFIAAKSFGVRVEIFSIGFGPRLWGRRRGDTDYRVSALPLGGYVKMAGDTPGEERTGGPDEFQSKPRWQRVVIALAGPVMNLLMAVVLVTGVFAFVGIPYPAYFDKPAEIVGVPPNSPASQAGLRAGDRIAEFDGLANPTWEQMQEHFSRMEPGKELPVTVERKGERLELAVRAGDPRDMMSAVGWPPMAAVVDQVSPGMPAHKAGLESGDEIVSLNGEPVLTWPQFAQGIRSSNGKTLEVAVRRGGKTFTLQITPVQVESPRGTVWQIGMLNRPDIVYRKLGLSAAVEQGVLWNALVTRQIVTVVGQLFTGQTSLRQMQGVVGIARESGQAARRGLVDVINLMAVISLNLGILNLLPIPILDGGHIVVLAVEGLLRRDLSLSLKERIVQVGFVFLLVVFAFVMYNDLVRLFPGR